jgi:predicted ATPase
MQEAVALARELSHSFSLAWALSNTAFHHQLRGEGQLTQEWAEAAITFSREQGFPYWVARGEIARGWVLAEQRQEEEGITQIHQGLAAWQTTGTELWRPSLYASLAEAYGKVGQAAEGLAVLADALVAVEKSKAGMWEAELYRLKGQLTLQSQSSPRQVKTGQDKSEDTNPPIPNPQAEAEACFLKAIEIARKQQAKSLELRAVMSLSRLWQQQGKRDEARQMLAEVYNWFTEGFDTKDLQEAKALLEELT